MDHDALIGRARALLERAIIRLDGRPVGTAAACDDVLEAANYHECFVRDFVPSALYFLMRGEPDIVRNFLVTVMELRGQQPVLKAHSRSRGLMPASFHVIGEGSGARVVADFGDRAIGRVIPVDSAMWWMFLLRAYTLATGDRDLVASAEVQRCLREILDLYLRETFESSPTLLVPDGAFMIDRRMGVYGHPLEIQALYYGMLCTAHELLDEAAEGPRSAAVSCTALEVRIQALRDYVRHHYWVDRRRLNEIHRFRGEEAGLEARNQFNVYPESIPEWLDGWLDDRSGYLVGNQGPGRVDFRFFAQGNLLAILFGLASTAEAHGIMNLYVRHWDELVGEMPLKICYPAVSGEEWQFLTGSDPKNHAWAYHNGGNWPVLIWPFVGAVLRTGRLNLAEQAMEMLAQRVELDDWPEYYDGRYGSLVGRRANYQQTWTATGLLVADELLENPRSRELFNRITMNSVV